MEKRQIKVNCCILVMGHNPKKAQSTEIYKLKEWQ